MGEDRGSAAASGVALPGGRTASCRTHSRTSTNYIHMGGCGPGGRRSNLSKHPLPVLAFSVNARRGGSWGHSGLGGGQPPTLIEAYVLGAGPHRPQPFPQSRLRRGQPSLGHRTLWASQDWVRGKKGLVAAASFQQAQAPALQTAQAAPQDTLPAPPGRVF